MKLLSLQLNGAYRILFLIVMSKKILLVLIAVSFAVSGFSQITIGTHSGNTFQIPVDGYYEYSYTQQIVYNTEIRTSGEITSISFFYVSGNPNRSKKWQILLGHTEKNSFDNYNDWIPGSELTTVFDGTVNFPGVGNWVTINFTTPFDYDSSDNLVIAVVEKEPRRGAEMLFAKTPTRQELPPRGIVYSDNGNLPDPNNPPEAYTLIEFINYMQLGGLVNTCVTPANFTAEEVELHSIEFSWTEEGESESWEILYGLKGFNPDTEGTLVSATETSKTITDLQSQTEYDFYIRAVCDVDEYSMWSDPLTISTLCGAADMPYSLTFEEGSNCTSIENRGSGNDWKRVQGPTSGFDGIYAAYIWNQNNANAWLYTQALMLHENVSYKLTYKYGNNSTYFTERMKVAIGNENNADSMTHILADHPEITGGIPQYGEVVFQATETGEFYVGFNAYSEPNQFYLFLDDIYIEALPGDVYVFENDAWTPNDPSGIASMVDDIIVINGNPSISANTTIQNITIRPGAKLNVEAVLNLYGNITIEGDLVFKSSPTKNGELGHVAENSTILGEATVERYMKDKRSYRMISPAVTTSTAIRENWQEGVNNTSTTENLNPNPGYGTHISGSTTGANGFDATISGNPSLFTLNVEQQSWTAVGNTNQTTLEAGNPFLLFVRGDRSIDLNSNASSGSTVLRTKGTLYTGNHTQNFSNSENSPYFAMFGNPYQSTVDVTKVLNGDNAVNVNSEYYYIYDPEIGVNGGYVTVLFGEDTVTIPPSDANEFIQPGQAAQFVTLASGPSSVTFTEEAKAPGEHTTTNSAPSSAIDNSIRADLYSREYYQEGKRSHDGFAIFFDQNYTNEITSSDALKPMNFRENLGIRYNGILLSAEKREMPVAAEVYQLFSTGYSSIDYTIVLNINGLEDQIFYLDDNYLGESVMISSETVYHFSVDENEMSKADDRFSIRVESNLGIENTLFSGSRLFPNPLYSETFYIYAPNLNGEKIEIEIFDMAGRKVFNKQLSTIDNKITVSTRDNLASGVYVVSLKSEKEKADFRLIKK